MSKLEGYTIELVPRSAIQSFIEKYHYSHNTNGVQGLALDLISFDSKYKKAFSYVFGNTLIVDTIHTARRLGIGSVRMVSLEGDLVETSGAMHGGFRKRQGKFLEKDLINNLGKLENKLGEAEGVVSAAIVALDRQEREEGRQVSISLEEQLKIPICSISNLENLITFLESTDKKGLAESLKFSLKE